MGSKLLKLSVVSTLLLVVFFSTALETKAFSVGVIADMHASSKKERKKSKTNRLYPKRYNKNIRPALAKNFDLYILLGDQTNDGDKKYTKKVISLFKNRNVYYTLGNHDKKSSWKLFMPSQEKYYFKDRDNWRLIFLNSNEADGNGEGFIGATQLNWLKDALKTDKKVFIAMHHPIFQKSGSDQVIAVYSELKKILEDSGNVEYVFSGHKHTRNDCQKDNDIEYCFVPALSLRGLEGAYRSVNLD